MIEIRELSYGYGLNKPVLKGLTLEWPAGRVAGLLGINGVGKTTLMKLFAGLLLVKQGELKIAGQSAKGRGEAFLQQSFFVAESPLVLPCRIGQFKALHAPLYGNFRETNWQRAVQVFELDEQASLGSLSTGWLKKVYLAFALASGCPLLLLDEPTNGLDISAKGQFRSLLAELVDEHQSVLISTHQVRDLHQSLDSLWLLDEQGVSAHLLEALPFELADDLEALFTRFVELGHQGVTA